MRVTSFSSILRARRLANTPPPFECLSLLQGTVSVTSRKSQSVNYTTRRPSRPSDIPAQQRKLLNALSITSQYSDGSKTQAVEDEQRHQEEVGGTGFGATNFEPPTPKDLCRHLDSYVIGQESMKKKVAVALFNHYLRVSHNYKIERLRKLGKPVTELSDVVLDKSNILLIGPSGSGKTLIAKTIAQVLDVPFSMNDATPLTQSGYVGEDVEVIIYRLLQNANFDAQLASRGIVFLDEIDKIARRMDATNPNQRDVSGEGVQQGLLRILEGTNVTINVKPGVNKPGSGEQFIVDTTNILFVLSGAFVGLERIVRDRISKKGGLGFGAFLKETDSEAKKQEESWTELIEAEDLVKFGFIPEFVGRVPLVGVARSLSEPELVRILIEPRNAITRQYQEIFSRFGVDLKFSSGALSSIAAEARTRNVGARGLRRIMDIILSDAQFDLPGSNYKFCVVTSDVVAKKSPLHLFQVGDETLVHRLLKSDDSNVGIAISPQAQPIHRKGDIVFPLQEGGEPRRKEAVSIADSSSTDVKC